MGVSAVLRYFACCAARASDGGRAGVGPRPRGGGGPPRGSPAGPETQVAPLQVLDGERDARPETVPDGAVVAATGQPRQQEDLGRHVAILAEPAQQEVGVSGREAHLERLKRLGCQASFA